MLGVKIVRIVDTIRAIVVGGLQPNHSFTNDNGTVDMKHPQKNPPNMSPC